MQKQNGSPNHVSLRSTFLQRATSWGKGIWLPWETTSPWNKFLNVWQGNTRQKCNPNQNIIYIIGQLLKLTYLQWSCILDLKLWAKCYDGKKSYGSKFSSCLFPRKKSELSGPKEQFLVGNKFQNVWQANTWDKCYPNQTLFIPLKSFRNLHI